MTPFYVEKHTLETHYHPTTDGIQVQILDGPFSLFHQTLNYSGYQLVQPYSSWYPYVARQIIETSGQTPFYGGFDFIFQLVEQGLSLGGRHLLRRGIPTDLAMYQSTINGSRHPLSYEAVEGFPSESKTAFYFMREGRLGDYYDLEDILDMLEHVCEVTKNPSLRRIDKDLVKVFWTAPLVELYPKLYQTNWDTPYQGTILFLMKLIEGESLETYLA